MRFTSPTAIILTAIVVGSVLTSGTGLLLFGSGDWGVLVWLVPLGIHAYIVLWFSCGENLIEDIIKCVLCGIVTLTGISMWPQAWPFLGLFIASVAGTIANQRIRHLRGL